MCFTVLCSVPPAGPYLFSIREDQRVAYVPRAWYEQQPGGEGVPISLYACMSVCSLLLRRNGQRQFEVSAAVSLLMFTFA